MLTCKLNSSKQRELFRHCCPCYFLVRNVRYYLNKKFRSCHDTTARQLLYFFIARKTKKCDLLNVTRKDHTFKECWNIFLTCTEFL